MLGTVPLSCSLSCLFSRKNRVTTFDLLFRTHERLGRAIVSANNIREICLADGLVRLDLGELIGIALQTHIIHIIIRQTASAVEAALLDQGQQGLDTVTPKLRAKLIFDGEPVSSRFVTSTCPTARIANLDRQGRCNNSSHSGADQPVLCSTCQCFTAAATYDLGPGSGSNFQPFTKGTYSRQLIESSVASSM